MRPHRALGRFAFSEKSSSILPKYAQYFQEQDDNVHIQRSSAINCIVDRLWYPACPSPVIADIPAHEQRNDPIKYIVMNSKHECFNDFQNHNGQESHEQCPLYSFKEVRGGTLYENALTVGIHKPAFLAALNAPIQALKFPEEMGRAWLTHNVEEVGNLQFFLPDLYRAERRV